MLRRRISPARGGGFTVRLPAAERELLQSLPEQLDDVLAALESFAGRQAGGDEGAGDDPVGPDPTGPATGSQEWEQSAGAASGSPGPGELASLRRLFPPAYSTDEEAQRNYESVTRSELSSHHRRALSTLSRTARATIDRCRRAERVADGGERPASRPRYGPRRDRGRASEHDGSVQPDGGVRVPEPARG